MKLIYIKWRDAFQSQDWKSELEAQLWLEQADYVVEDVGWLVGETEDYISIIYQKAEMLVEGEREYRKVGTQQMIPKACIIEKKVIKI